MILKSFSLRERRVLRILIIVTILSRIAFAFRPEWRIATRPFNDDSFYIFTVSDHLARGEGLSVDGIHPTNGIQPLITFLYTPFFMIAGGDKLLAIRLSFILIALCDALSVLFIAKLVKQLRKMEQEAGSNIWLHPPIIAAALWTFLFPIIIQTTNGLETGLYSFFIILSLYVYVNLRNESQAASLTQGICFGALLGLTVLARIDAAFFVIAFSIIEIFRYRMKGLKIAGIIALTSAIVSSPWWIYNYVQFGSLMPQSGQSESMMNMLRENLSAGANALGNICSIAFFIPPSALPEWGNYAFCTVMVIGIFFLCRRFGIYKHLKEYYNLRSITPLFIFGSLLLIYYIFFFGAPHFLQRYFQPLRIFSLIITACSLPALITYSRQQIQGERKLMKFSIRAFIFSAGIFSLAGYVYYFFVPSPNPLYSASQWVTEHPKERIGMLQSGIAGFFSPNVINLDGKVNYEALRAIQHTDIGDYINRQDFDYIVDSKGIVTPLIDAAGSHGSRFNPIDTFGIMIIFKRIR